jgi:hypothetical protein
VRLSQHAEAILNVSSEERDGQLGQDSESLVKLAISLCRDERMIVLSTLTLTSEMANLLGSWPSRTDGLTDPDAPTTKPGKLWLLGRHRLLCGDSSRPEDVDQLPDGAPVQRGRQHS